MIRIEEAKLIFDASIVLYFLFAQNQVFIYNPKLASDQTHSLTQNSKKYCLQSRKIQTHWKLLLWWDCFNKQAKFLLRMKAWWIPFTKISEYEKLQLSIFHASKELSISDAKLC